MERPIKALFVFPVSQIWGGEAVWINFLKRMDRNKIIPFCLIFGSGELIKRIEEANAGYYKLSNARIRNIFQYLRNLFHMIRFFKKERFDVVNSLGVHLLTTLSTSFLNIPYILHIHTIHHLPFIDRWCLRRARHIITVSNFSKEFLINYNIKPKNIEVIYNGIDIVGLEKKTKGLDLRQELGLDKNTKIVCYMGRIVKWKNLEDLIRAVPKIKKGCPGKIKFLFVGDTPKRDIRETDYKDTLLKLAEELGVKGDIIFTGRREDVEDILKNIDIYAIPSLLEVCSMSILEAMALGKPIVAINTGGNPEIVTDEVGILVEPYDLESFAKAIVSLLKDEKKRQNIGEAGKKKVEQFFNIKDNIDRLERIMKSLSKNYVYLKGELSCE